MVPEGHPGVRMSEDQMGLVQTALLGAIDGAVDGEVRPRFLQVSKEGGIARDNRFRRREPEMAKGDGREPETLGEVEVQGG